MESNLSGGESDISFWRSIFLSGVFFLITPVVIGISLFSLFSLKSNQLAEQKFNTKNLSISPMRGVSVYASLPITTPLIRTSIDLADARPEIIKKYLSFYNSPLEPYSELIVKTADKYSLDFRLVTAIAQQESNLCKIIPPGSYNCWGWGIHEKGTLGFDSFEEGIDVVSQGLRQNYLDKGYNTIEEIMSKYTPQSNGSWARGVTSFMQDME